MLPRTAVTHLLPQQQPQTLQQSIILPPPQIHIKRYIGRLHQNRKLGQGRSETSL